MTTYHTKTRRAQRAPGRSRQPARNYLADAVNWIAVLALVAFIVILLASPLLKPP